MSNYEKMKIIKEYVKERVREKERERKRKRGHAKYISSEIINIMLQMMQCKCNFPDEGSDDEHLSLLRF